MDDEFIDIIDENGIIVGQTTRQVAFMEGILHPAVNIILVNSKGEIYIQQRSINKAAFPLYWDTSVGEHVMRGESFRKAAFRGLEEELSVIGVSIKLIRGGHIQKSEYKRNNRLIKDYEFVKLYLAFSEKIPKINHQEIRQGKFISLRKISNMLENNDKKVKFTPWGRDELRYILQNLKSVKRLTH